MKTKLQTAQPEYNKNAMQEMEAFGYNLAAFDAMKRMEKYNEMTANISSDERRILDKYNSVLWMIQSSSRWLRMPLNYDSSHCSVLGLS